MNLNVKNQGIKKSLLPRLSLAIGALSLACLMQGCGEVTQDPAGGTQPPTQTQAQTQATTQEVQTQASTTGEAQTQTATPPSADQDVTAALKLYYENLVENLRAELLEEKENRYIAEYQNQNRIKELEATIATLEKELGKDTPVGGEPATDTPQTEAQGDVETEAQTEAPSLVPKEIFDYKVVDEQACITGYRGSDKVVNIPSEINGYVVTSIEDNAFQSMDITSVILPPTLKHIGWFAFEGCYELEIVSIPASVAKICYGAFDGCPNLTIVCPADSYASSYAVSFGLAHQYV